MTKEAYKQFTPEELSEALGFPKGSRVIGFRPVDWDQQWELVYDYSKKGVIPQFPKQCLTIEAYEDAFREFLLDTWKAKDTGHPYPVKPHYVPVDLELRVIEEEQRKKSVDTLNGALYK